MNFRALSLGILVLFLGHCGGIEEDHQSQDQIAQESQEPLAPYRYRFRNVTNGLTCDTGEHSFEDKAAYCKALANDRLNRNCALDARRDEYAEQCQEFAGAGATSP